MDLVTIFRILWRKVWFLVGIPMAVIIISFILTSDYKQIYRSIAQLSTGFTISQEVNVTSERFNLYEADVKFSNLIETMKSSRVLLLLSYRLILHDLMSEGDDVFTNVVVEDEKDRAFLNDLDMESMVQLYQKNLDSMAMLNTYNENERDAQKLLEVYGYDYDEVKKKLTIKRVNNTDYVSIEAFTEDPLLSAYMVNTLCSEFIRFNANITSIKSSSTVETFSKLLTEKRKELDKATDALQYYKSQNRMLNFELEKENQISRVSDLQLDLQEERKKYTSITLQLQDINRRLSDSNDRNRVTNADVVEIRNKINEMNERYRNLGGRSEVLRDSLEILRNIQGSYLRIISAGAEGNSQDALNDEKENLELDLQIVNQNISDLEQTIRATSSNVGGFASKEARIATLEREVDLASEDYREAQEKYNLALNVSMASGSSISQILLGLPASKAEPSKRIIVSGISGVSAFILIVFVIVLLEYLDISIRSASKFVDKTEMPLIGSLNHINTNGYDIGSSGSGNLVSRNLSRFGLSARKNGEKLSNSDGAKEEVLFEENHTRSKDFFNVFDSSVLSNTNRTVFREQLRKIRYLLVNSGKKVILFTSTKEGEGKTSLISALAASLNQSLLRVLVIDTNFANPSLTKTLHGLPIMEKIFEKKKESKSEISKNFIAMFAKNTVLPYVDIIGCKGGEYTPIEIIRGNSLESLIEDLKDKYDYIFFEGSALNTNSGSRELSSYVDGVITVFSAKSVLGQLDYDSIDFIEGLGEKNMGAVINDVEIKDMKS